MAYLEHINLIGNTTDFYPQAIATEPIEQEASFDPHGNLHVRGAVLTDEGTFRVNFANTSLRVSIGTCTFTNGSTTVTGVNFDTYDLKVGDYVNIDGHSEFTLNQVESITPTQIVLTNPYSGATTTGTASRQLLRSLTGSGATISVASGAATISAGTTGSSVSVLGRLVDVAPLVFRAAFSVSQRIINQTINVGLNDESSPTKWFARFSLDGTTNTSLKCQTGRNPTSAPSGNEIQETTVTIPNNLNSSASLEYRIELLTEEVNFYINDILVARHTRVIPSQYDLMSAGIAVLNGSTAPASNTNVVIDYITCKNHNKLEVGVMSMRETILSQQPPLTQFNYFQTGVIPINTDLIVIDCSQFRSLSIQATAVGTSGVITAAFSNDGSNYVNQILVNTSSGTANTFNSTGLWTTPVYGRYFRLRLTTATTAGTTALVVQGYQLNISQPSAQPVSGTVTANIGTGSIAAGTNAIGDVGVQYRANATGAASRNHLVSAATTNATSIKGSVGRLLGWQVSNTNAAWRYVKLHNQATVPTAGTGVVQTIAVPPNQTVNFRLEGGIAFSTGISMTTVTGAADNDTTAVGLNDLIIDIFFA